MCKVGVTLPQLLHVVTCNRKNISTLFVWDIPVCGEYKLVQLIVNHTQWNTSHCYLLKNNGGQEQEHTYTYSRPSKYPDLSFSKLKHSPHTLLYRVSQEECEILRESVPYVKLYRYNPKHLYPKLNGYGVNGHRKVWPSVVSTNCTPSVTQYSSTAQARQVDFFM